MSFSASTDVLSDAVIRLIKPQSISWAISSVSGNYFAQNILTLHSLHCWGFYWEAGALRPVTPKLKNKNPCTLYSFKPPPRLNIGENRTRGVLRTHS